MFDSKEKGDITKTTGPLNTTINKDDKFITLIGTLEELEANIGLLYEKNKDFIPLGLSSKILETLSLMRDNLYHSAEQKEMLETTTKLLESSNKYMEEKISKANFMDLPIGSEMCAHTHVVKTISRRAEREFVSYNSNYTSSIRFLNILSKYLSDLAKFVII